MEKLGEDYAESLVKQRGDRVEARNGRVCIGESPSNCVVTECDIIAIFPSGKRDCLEVKTDPHAGHTTAQKNAREGGKQQRTVFVLDESAAPDLPMKFDANLPTRCFQRESPASFCDKDDQLIDDSPALEAEFEFMAERGDPHLATL